MSIFGTLNFKSLACMAIATLPSLLLVGGFDSVTAQAVTQAQARQEITAPLQLAQSVDVSGKAVLVD